MIETEMTSREMVVSRPTVTNTAVVLVPRRVKKIVVVSQEVLLKVMMNQVAAEGEKVERTGKHS